MAHASVVDVETGEDWLRWLIVHGRQRDACMTWGCTTCGATPFRKALWNSAALAGPDDPAREIARQLTRYPAGADVRALRLVICDLNARADATAWERLRQIVARSFAGAELLRMQEHHEGVLAQRLAHALRSDPAYAAEQRAFERTGCWLAG